MGKNIIKSTKSQMYIVLYIYIYKYIYIYSNIDFDNYDSY